MDEYVEGSNYFTISTETAWSPTTELWELICGKYKDIQHVYTAEECGSGIYINTDIDGVCFNERYKIEVVCEEIQENPLPEGIFKIGVEAYKIMEAYEYFDSEEDLLNYANSILQEPVKSLNEFRDIYKIAIKLHSPNSNGEVYIREFTKE